MQAVAQEARYIVRGRRKITLRPRPPAIAKLASNLDHSKEVMPMLNYAAPSTVDEAVRILAGASGAAKVLSGGTDLLVQLRSGRAKPDLIVDIKKIPGISGIREEGGAFVIGAATPGAVIGENKALRQAWPGVVEAANLIGSTQVQGRASLAGNLCNASPAADSVPALIAARATCVVASANGRREVPVESIPTGPGRTSLKKGEFIVEFHLPKRPPRSADAYLRFIPRTEMDIAVVGAGVSLTLDAAGVCTDARVVLGAVAPTAVLVAEAATALIGHKLDEATLDALDQAARRACKPIDDKRGTIEYRTKVAGVMARRAATIAHERAGKQR
jgi:carbon-monoxide dehydrogenase medium subunit